MDKDAMRIRSLLLALPPILLALGAALIVQMLAGREQLAMDRKAAERLTLYRETILGEVAKYRYLPYVIARDPRATSALVARETSARASRFLAELSKASGANLLYVMDGTGETVASSNFETPLSLVGRNYGFRPYFRDAMAGREGQYFAIGVTTGRPGLFLAQPTPVDGEPRGVTVVKVETVDLEKTWTDGGEVVFASDPNGVIFLSSVPEWRYRTLGQLPETARLLLEETRQYAGQTLDPLTATSPKGGSVISVDGIGYRHNVAEVGLLGWNLHFLTPDAGGHRDLWFVWAGAAGLGLLYAVAVLVWRGRALRRASVRLREESDSLRELNIRLTDEVEERKRVENELRDAQEGLARSNRLAAVGQMSAAVAHELNQPLAALRMFTAGTRLFLEKEDTPSARQNLTEIDALQHRMAVLTQELKRFARPGESRIETVDLSDSIVSATKIATPRFDETAVALTSGLPGTALMAKTAPLRVEQILLNLLRNGADAASQTGEGEVRLRAFERGDQIIIQVSDNGAGVPEELREKIFDPFFTTKLSSGGLGLGLSISASIAEDLGGRLSVRSNDLGGATFELALPGLPDEAERPVATIQEEI